MQLRLWVIATLLSAMSLPVAAAGGDEAWIENFMSQPGRSAGPAQIRRGYLVDWREVGRFTEVPVKVTTDLGRVYHGYIERVDADTMWLRAELYGGYANLVLRRNQVLTTELE